MSTHAIIAAVFDDGTRGVYVHHDGHPQARISGLAELIARDGVEKVRYTICGNPFGWSEIGTAPSQQTLRPGMRDGRFAVVDGYGISYTRTDNPGRFWTPEEGDQDWDVSYVYTIHPDGTVDYREAEHYYVGRIAALDAISGEPAAVWTQDRHVCMRFDWGEDLWLTPSGVRQLALALLDAADELVADLDWKDESGAPRPP
jgi:hypothetical protein